MTRKIHVLILFLLLAAPFAARSQEAVWNLGFDLFFDNREYDNLRPRNWSQSIFGARVSPEVGIRWDERHAIMVGGNFLVNFGDTPFREGNYAVAYYQYESPRFSGYGGVIPRKKLIGEYGQAFFSDSVKYYDPHLTGILLQYRGGRGYLEFGADWNSMITDTRREKFLLFTAGRLDISRFYAGFSANMYHHAGTIRTKGVVDNVLVNPYLGVRLHDLLPLDLFTIQAGWLQAFQNEREYRDIWVDPGGFQIDLKIEKWNFGIEETFYKGGDLMPYYVAPPTEYGFDYGPGLYWGEPFYRTNNHYNRLEIYWQPVRNDRMSLRVSSVHHNIGNNWGWQQKVIFSVYLGPERFTSKSR